MNLGTSSLETECLAAESAKPSDNKVTWSELVERGWCPLILMLMYEHWRAKQGANPSWGPYFGMYIANADVMPSKFDTPMFWTQEEIQNLNGTDVVDKIGQADAERDYSECVLPYIQQYPRVFVGTEGDDAAESIQQYYNLEIYHRMGSSILSRSFHVKRDLKHAEADDADIHSVPAEVSVQREIPGEDEGEEVQLEQVDEEDEEENDDEDEEEEDEDVRDISMVPMADMLNARFGSENTRLFYKREVLEMRCTKPVAIGEQLLNTYGNPPNSDLLRRYGFVDEPNRGDLVELPAELVVEAAVSKIVLATGASQAEVEAMTAARFEWACTELGMDEVFLLSRLSKPEAEAPFGSTLSLDVTQPAVSQKKALSRAAAHIPEDLVSFARLLCVPQPGFAKAQKRGALPNARLDAIEEFDMQGPRTAEGRTLHLAVASVLLEAMDKRLAQYPLGWQQTAEVLRTCTEPPNTPHRMALVVRAGDQTILTEHTTVLRLILDQSTAERVPRSDSAKKQRKA
ncbi:Ribosomal lysine N-methyltransferase 4 [Malassezia obtusa]|uniref:Ribosomal lysine N-methyltransferase 4 n=1 Tax=Malassezia obtusa TaxID=76774 RepID=A0AAF0E1M5_9BASI|nr:Ribosomal lysine N-methyltransferase 4 [Malassezia obtusa]